MVRYIIRRLLWTGVTLIIVSFLTFVIFYVLPPGDPAVLRAGHFPNPLQLAHIRHALGVDKPFWVQYRDYIRAIVLHFDLGYSYQYAAPVSRLIFDHLPATISLTVGAVIVWLIIGIPIGIIFGRPIAHRPGPGSDGRRVTVHLRTDVLAGPGQPVPALQ